jgi:hypothetical protein
MKKLRVESENLEARGSKCGEGLRRSESRRGPTVSELHGASELPGA